MKTTTSQSTYEYFKNNISVLLPNSKVIGEKIRNEDDGSISFFPEINFNNKLIRPVHLNINPETPDVIEFRGQRFHLSELPKLIESFRQHFVF